MSRSARTWTAVALQFIDNGYRVLGNGHRLTFRSDVSGFGGLVRIDPGVTAEIQAEIAGTTGLTMSDAGTLILTGANCYSGGTTIRDGMLQVGAGGTSGSLIGDVANDALLAFNRSDAVTFAGTISGAGVVEQAGAGTLSLTGTNSYTGGTLVSAGILQIARDANIGGPSGALMIDLGTLRWTAFRSRTNASRSRSVRAARASTPTASTASSFRASVGRADSPRPAPAGSSSPA